MFAAQCDGTEAAAFSLPQWWGSTPTSSEGLGPCVVWEVAEIKDPS